MTTAAVTRDPFGEPPSEVVVSVSDQSADLFVRGAQVLMFERRWLVEGRVVLARAWWTEMPGPWLRDPILIRLFRSSMADHADRVIRPWRYPDPPAFPEILLWPRTVRAGRWAADRLRRAGSRARRLR